MSKIHVSVVEAFADSASTVELLLDAGSTVADALATPEVQALFPDAQRRAFGIYSRRMEEPALLREGDRIELYRPLIADAKQNRMERVKAERAGSRKR